MYKVNVVIEHINMTQFHKNVESGKKTWKKKEFALRHFINKFLWFPLGDVCYVCTKISNVMVNDKSAFKEH